MDGKQMSPIEKLEWAAKTKEITDGHVLELFLNCEIEKAEDIDKVFRILEKNRPDLVVLVVGIYSCVRQSKGGS